MAVKPWLGAIRAPSDFNGVPENQDEKPDVDISLEYVYGYRVKDSRNNLFFVNGRLYYYAAALGIQLNFENRPFS